MGFPTANLVIPKNIIEPASGVYSGTVEIDGKIYHSVINVGKRPTFGDLVKDIIEAHVLDFSGDIYNKTIEVSFLRKIRDEKKFSSLDELKEQIRKDCESIIFSIN